MNKIVDTFNIPYLLKARTMSELTSAHRVRRTVSKSEVKLIFIKQKAGIVPAVSYVFRNPLDRRVAHFLVSGRVDRGCLRIGCRTFSRATTKLIRQWAAS